MKLQSFLRNSSAALLTEYLTNALCSFEHTAPDYEALFVHNKVAKVDRLTWLSRNLANSHYLLKSAWFEDVHAYSCGNQGLSNIARFIARMGLRIILHPGIFGPEMFGIMSVLDGMEVGPVEVVSFPPLWSSIGDVFEMKTGMVCLLTHSRLLQPTSPKTLTFCCVEVLVQPPIPFAVVLFHSS